MIDTQQYKKRLEEERVRLIEELKEVGRRSSEDPKNWEPAESEHDRESADPVDVADNIEELATNVAIEGPLEKRLETVDAALARIEEGTYGVCSFGGTDHPIEEARLGANAAAKTCIEHLDQEM